MQRALKVEINIVLTKCLVDWHAGRGGNLCHCNAAYFTGKRLTMLALNAGAAARALVDKRPFVDAAADIGNDDGQQQQLTSSTVDDLQTNVMAQQQRRANAWGEKTMRRVYLSSVGGR